MPTFNNAANVVCKPLKDKAAFFRKQVFYLAAIMDVPGVLPTAASMMMDVGFEAIFLAEQLPGVAAENVQT